MGSEGGRRIVVVGAGPAGLAAASAAAESGGSVTVLDDNPAAGGQIWRGKPAADAMRWLARFETSGAQLCSATQVVAPAGMRCLLAEQNGRPKRFEYDQLILATGARELLLPFPGWTLPGVTGAGGLQALVRSGLPARGKRVVLCGTGPLLLAVGAHLRELGARVEAIAEQAEFGS